MPDVERLANNEIHVWAGSVSNFLKRNLLDHAYSLLSVAEKKNYEKFVRKEDQHRFLFGRYICKTRLSSYDESVRPADWSFEFNQFGRPSLALDNKKEQIHFNLSHSSDLVVCAFSRCPEIGVDIEDTSRERNFLEISQSHFSHSEHQRMMDVEDLQRNKTFFQIWTLKEAFAKAKGLGLQFPLEKVCFNFTESEKVKIVFHKDLDEDSSRWSFRQRILFKKFQLAIAIAQKEPLHVTIRSVDGDHC